MVEVAGGVQPPGRKLRISLQVSSLGKQNRFRKVSANLDHFMTSNVEVRPGSSDRWSAGSVYADIFEYGNPGFGPLGIEVETQGFQTVRLITSQKFPWKNLKLISSILTFEDLPSHICQIFMRVPLWLDENI